MGNRVIFHLGDGDDTVERENIRVPNDGEQIDLDGHRFTVIGTVITRLSDDSDPDTLVDVRVKPVSKPESTDEIVGLKV